MNFQQRNRDSRPPFVSLGEELEREIENIHREDLRRMIFASWGWCILAIVTAALCFVL